MPSKRASAAAPKAGLQLNGVKAASKVTSRTTVSKTTAATKTAAINSVNKKAAIRASSPSTEPKPASKSKRKATEEPVDPTVNGAKRRKASKEPIEPPSPKQKSAGTKSPIASKRPKTTKAKVVINERPTQRLNVYVFGTGDNGELGLGSEKGQITVKRPRLNPFLAADTVGVVQMAVGGSHSAALTHDNKILTWGVNDEGALGRDVTWEAPTRDIDDEKSDGDSDDDSETGINPKEATPTAIDMSVFPDGTVFTQLVAGDSMTFALTDEGLVYGWGTFRVWLSFSPPRIWANLLNFLAQGNEGVIGFRGEKGEIVRIEHRPVLVEGLKKITKLACGSNHVLALASNGAVYAWGSGQQHQLGRRTVERTKHNALTPREFGLPKGTVDIGAGSYHSFAVNKNGKVYAWGLNSYGETGIQQGAGEDEAVVLHPTVIESLKGKGKITCITGGAHHSVAVTEAGHCLVWGRIDGCQSGLDISTLPEDHLIRDSKNNPRILAVPTRVPDLDAVYAAAGSDHCIAISRDGKAYSWGFSQTYQTGQGQDDEVEIATHIDNTAVRGKKLVWAGAGGQFSAVAGLADYGQLVNGVNGH
jgi:regulator of chromosome condensation